MSSCEMDENAVFPGEGWFFYWKTSASLWKSKIQEQKMRKLIVPINWAFHSETGEGADFGTLRPETDLFRLSQICYELAVEICFLLPITPVPFLANGGVPHLLARSPSADPNGISWMTIDGVNTISKLYSFFDHRVYESYAEFVEILGRYFSEKGISSSLRGLSAGYIRDGERYSYLLDSSQTFDRAFSRFLSVNKRNDVLTIDEEYKKKEEFFREIRDLYLSAAKTSLATNWEGVVKISFIGGSDSDFIKRAWNQHSLRSYFLDALHAISWGTVPSSILLDSRVKESSLGIFLNEVVISTLDHHFFPSSSEGEQLGFRALKFFEVFQEDVNLWKTLGLWEYLEDSYRWTYGKKTYEDDRNDCHGIIFCQGKEIDSDFFNFIVKKFLNGFNIVIDQSDLDESLRQKLMLFILENSLKTEKVNKYTNITNITLGDGRITLFDGKKLRGQPKEKLKSFWKVFFSTYEIRHLNLEKVDGVEISWKTRDAAGSELNYEEVRRLSLYNRTSYKKRQRLKLIKNSVLTKVVDECNATVKTSPEEIEINLLPSGTVSLDFGFYS